jgi:hypothetical protein
MKREEGTVKVEEKGTSETNKEDEQGEIRNKESG